MYVAYSIDRLNSIRDTGGNNLINFPWLNHQYCEPFFFSPPFLTFSLALSACFSSVTLIFFVGSSQSLASCASCKSTSLFFLLFLQSCCLSFLFPFLSESIFNQPTNKSSSTINLNEKTLRYLNI